MNAQGQSFVLVKATVRTGKIIVGALIAGILSFGVVAFLSESKPANTGILMILGGALAVIQVGLWFVVPGLISQSQLKKINELGGDEQQASLAQLYLTRKIIAAALLEGAGLFNWVCYMVDRNPVSLAVVGILIGLLIITMPSQGQFEGWAEDMKRYYQ
jgi:hypothetical protein